MFNMFDLGLKPVVKMDIGQIMKARKLNQRAKAQKRGRPTAGVDGREISSIPPWKWGRSHLNDCKRVPNRKAKRKAIKRAKVVARKAGAQ